MAKLDDVGDDGARPRPRLTESNARSERRRPGEGRKPRGRPKKRPKPFLEPGLNHVFETITVTINGKKTSITRHQLMLDRYFELAVKGNNIRALHSYVKLAGGFAAIQAAAYELESKERLRDTIDDLLAKSIREDDGAPPSPPDDNPGQHRRANKPDETLSAASQLQDLLPARREYGQLSEDERREEKRLWTELHGVDPAERKQLSAQLPSRRLAPDDTQLKASGAAGRGGSGESERPLATGEHRESEQVSRTPQPRGSSPSTESEEEAYQRYLSLSELERSSFDNLELVERFEGRDGCNTHLQRPDDAEAICPEGPADRDSPLGPDDEPSRVFFDEKGERYVEV